MSREEYLQGFIAIGELTQIIKNIGGLERQKYFANKQPFQGYRTSLVDFGFGVTLEGLAFGLMKYLLTAIHSKEIRTPEVNPSLTFSPR
jgi:hypothetical protein